MKALKETNFNFPGQKDFYRGKVRDVYYFDDKILVVASDRISAFDHILPRAIPFKGQILNQIAQYFLEASSDIVPNWLEANPDPNVSYGKKAEAIKLEMVVRGYLVGHAWREYKRGERILCGAPMPEDMKEADKFPEPIITPATKAEEGHDEDISPAEILERGIVSQEVWDQLVDYTLKLYQRGSEMAREKGLILVDTKYEFGICDGKIILIDEIHTPDSSRYFILDGYEERQANGEKQKQLSKEFVREWLMSKGFQGKDGQQMPEMDDAFVDSITERYVELYEKVTGRKFEGSDYVNINERIENNVLNFLNS